MSGRVDRIAVAQGLAPTRAAAARLIGRGGLRVRDAAGLRTVRTCGETVAADAVLEVADGAELRWASRAGLKLDGALDGIGLDVAGAVCLDVGQSTGGFTDVLLARDAASVVGVDVGHGQLLPRLRADPRVACLEGVNARDLTPAALPVARYDLVVADLSFISLALVLPALAPLAARDLLLLVKPQFELSRAAIGKGGLVRDPVAAAPLVEAKLRGAAEAAGLRVCQWFASPIEGGDGNREFFLHCTP